MRIERLAGVLCGFADGTRFEEDADCVFGRDLAIVTGARDWGEFSRWLDLARRDCEAGSEGHYGHFTAATRAILVAPGEIMFQSDVRLSLYACFLVARVAAPVSETAALLCCRLRSLLAASPAGFFRSPSGQRGFMKPDSEC